MIPADLGLPPKFSGWRKGQYETVEAIALSTKRFYMLSMPTGGGKSAVYMGVSRMLGARTLILTATKGLQAQLMRDFAAMGLTDVRGQGNYECIAEPGTTVDEGHCHGGGKCMFKQGGCTYYDAVRKAAKSELVVTNFSYWMTMNRYAEADPLGKFDLLIIDEAHEQPDALADFCAIRIDKAETHALLGLDLPPLDEGQEAWADWATHARNIAAQRYAAARARVNEGSKYTRLARRLKDIYRKVSELARAETWRRGDTSRTRTYVPGQLTDWIAEPLREGKFPYKVRGALFSPVWAHPYAEQYIYAKIPRVVMVSATLQKAAARYLGLTSTSYEYAEAASTFDPRKRPVYYLPTTTVDHKWTVGQQKVWVNKIDAIINARQDRKGIIHTRSYDRASIILAASKHRGIMLTHRSADTREVVEEFKQRRAPAVLVSPSVGTGWDFPYDECEYQIIAKTPFIDTRSGVLKARVKSDKKYANYVAALTIIQQYGRGMRAEDDSCETFIIDDHIAWFIHAGREFFPRWFMAAYQKATGVPEPIRKQTRRVR